MNLIKTRPMIISAVFALLASVFLFSASPAAILTAATICFAAFIIFLCIKPLREASVIAAVIFLMLLNAVRIYDSALSTLENTSHATFNISGTVTNVDYDEDFSIITVKVTEADSNLPRNIKVDLVYYKEGLTVGDEIEATAFIGGLKDSEYRASSYADGVYATGHLSELKERHSGNNVYSLNERIKNKVKNTLFSNMSYNSAALSTAMTIGDRAALSDNFNALVRRSGVSHVLVVSGLHLSVICGSFYQFVKRTRMNRYAGALLTGTVMLGFMAICGFSPSVVRAGIMYGIYLVGRVLYKRRDGLNSLSVAVSVMLIFNPFLIADVGFQLSALSTAGIIIILPRLEEYIDRYIKKRPINAVLKAASVTVSALIVTLPLTVYYFGEVSLVCILTNMLISFSVSVVLITSFIGVLLSVCLNITLVNTVIFFITDIAAGYMYFVIDILGGFKWAAVPCKLWIIILIYIFVIAFLALLKYTNNIRDKRRGVL